MAKEPVILLAPGVWRVPLFGDLVNGFLFRDDDGQVTVLDMGLKQSGKKVMAALGAIGSGPGDVTRLLLTHAHADHAGGTGYVAGETGLGVGVHEADAGFVAAGKVAPAATSLGRLMAKLSGSGSFAPVPVDEELHDGQVIDVAGGLRVVHTPGHSPGHASYLHESSGVLVTGDAIFNVRRIRWPVKAFCTDFKMTKQTAHRLGELEYDVAAFTHGPELRDGAREAIRTFLRKG
ncbi:MBL fold metallo-hydrolase [Nocardioides bigeumensis]|uniref:beta-lactamase n=1 Tax=Nocardioides bigeumensis TaxID=433657 RepID=A0ABN2YZA0_9ACTN